MPIFRRESKKSQPVAQAEQAVLVHIANMAGDDNGLDQVEDSLIEAIANAAVGEFDGNEVGPDGTVLYLYGADANALFDVVEPVLRASPIGPGAFALKRYGGPGAPETRVDLD